MVMKGKAPSSTVYLTEKTHKVLASYTLLVSRIQCYFLAFEQIFCFATNISYYTKLALKAFIFTSNIQIYFMNVICLQISGVCVIRTASGLFSRSEGGYDVRPLICRLFACEPGPGDRRSFGGESLHLLLAGEHGPHRTLPSLRYCLSVELVSQSEIPKFLYTKSNVKIKKYQWLLM